MAEAPERFGGHPDELTIEGLTNFNELVMPILQDPGLRE